MKFGIAKLTKTFYKNTEKKFKRKKQQQRIKLIRERKSKYKVLLRWKKKFFRLANSAPLQRSAGGALSSILVY